MEKGRYLLREFGLGVLFVGRLDYSANTGSSPKNVTMTAFSKDKISILLTLPEIDSCAALLKQFGLTAGSSNYRRLNAFAKANGIDLEPLKERGQKLIQHVEHCRYKIPDSEVFKKNSTYDTGSLRKRLLQLGWEYKCSTDGCGLSTWMDQPITLHVDHINGDGADHRLENLRFLCPNCHQQTETWGKGPSPLWRDCETCGARTKNPQYCSHKCYPRKGIGRPSTRKTARPTKEVLLIELQSSNWVAVGRKYGVTDNAIRKWVRFYNIDPKSIKTKRPPGGKKLEVPA